MKGANVGLFATRSVHIVGRFTELQDLKLARKYGEAWNQLVAVNAKAVNAKNEETQKEIQAIEEKNRELGHALNRKIIRGRKKGTFVFSDAEEEEDFNKDIRDLSRDASADSDDGKVLKYKRFNSADYYVEPKKEKQANIPKKKVVDDDDEEEYKQLKKFFKLMPRHKLFDSADGYDSSSSAQTHGDDANDGSNQRGRAADQRKRSKSPKRESSANRKRSHSPPLKIL